MIGYDADLLKYTQMLSYAMFDHLSRTYNNNWTFIMCWKLRNLANVRNSAVERLFPVSSKDKFENRLSFQYILSNVVFVLIISLSLVIKASFE